MQKEIIRKVLRSKINIWFRIHASWGFLPLSPGQVDSFSVGFFAQNRFDLSNPEGIALFFLPMTLYLSQLSLLVLPKAKIKRLGFVVHRFCIK